MDDEPPWVAAVGHGQAGGHFPGMHKGHTEVSKGSSEELVQREDEPFAAIHRLAAGVDQLENHKIATTAAQILVSHQIKKDSRKVVKWALAPPCFGGPLPGPPSSGATECREATGVRVERRAQLWARQCSTMFRVVSTAIRGPV